jgi:hypothetical protein
MYPAHFEKWHDSYLLFDKKFSSVVMMTFRNCSKPEQLRFANPFRIAVGDGFAHT